LETAPKIAAASASAIGAARAAFAELGQSGADLESRGQQLDAFSGRQELVPSPHDQLTVVRIDTVAGKAIADCNNDLPVSFV